MSTIRCKVPLIRNMVHHTAIDGFEGPALKNLADDGYGNTVQKGEMTSAYNTWYTEKEDSKGQKYYDGEIEIHDTPYNRNKIAAMVRHNDIRVMRSEIEDEILAQYPINKFPRKKHVKLSPTAVVTEVEEVVDEVPAIEAPVVEKETANTVVARAKMGRPKGVKTKLSILEDLDADVKE